MYYVTPDYQERRFKLLQLLFGAYNSGLL